MRTISGCKKTLVNRYVIIPAQIEQRSLTQTTKIIIQSAARRKSSQFQSTNMEIFTEPHIRLCAQEIHLGWQTLTAAERLYTADDLIREWQLPAISSTTMELTQIGQFISECQCLILHVANARNRRNHNEGFNVNSILNQLDITLTFLSTKGNINSQSRKFAAIISWTRGRLLLTLLYMGHDSMNNLKAWTNRCKQLGVTPQSYTTKWVQHKFVVYMKVAKHRAHYYIGSTSVSMQNREDARERKLSQMMHQTFVSCEVALRYWHHTGTVNQYVPIVIQHAEDKAQALAMEANFILTLQPQLNYPFILKFLPSSASNEFKSIASRRFQSIRNHRTGLRILKRMKNSQTVHLPNKSKQHILQNLYHLGFNSFHRFRVMKLLWSPKLQKEKFYMYVRLTTHMDAKYKPRAIQALQRIASKHTWEWPANSSPLCVPFLAHKDFKQDMKRFLQTHLHRVHATLIPFHWPPSTVLEGKHQQIVDALHNWRKWHRQFLRDDQPDCPCTNFINQYPGTPTVDGHVAGGLDQFPCPSHLLEVASTSAKDSYYPNRSQYTATITKLFHKWATKNHCSAPFPEEFIHIVWSKHLTEIKSRHLHDFSAITQLRKILNCLVVHCEDHHPTKLCAFCPQFYMQVITKMAQDTTVFGHLPLPPTHFNQLIPTMIPEHLRNAYPWAFKLDARIPTCYGLLKAKKQYKKARPIVSYSGTVFAPFFTMIGKLLQDLLDKTLPDTMGKGTINDVFQKIHNFLKNDPEAHLAELHNDDLVGFFVSVPHDRILQSVQFLVKQYKELHVPTWLNPDEVTFTVDLKKLAKFRTIRGRAIQHSSSQHIFHLKHLVDGVRLSLSASHFECLGHLYFQKRGSSIGSQCSPSICATVVAVSEAVWMRSYNILFNSSGLFVRYVDNRLICLPSHTAGQIPYRILLRLDFYGMPIELEECGNKEILGFTLNLEHRTCTYNFPTAPHQFRHPKSAGSERSILSGFESRLHLIYSRTFPKSLIRPHAQRLINLYLERGFSARILSTIKTNVQRTISKKRKNTNTSH